MNYTWIIQLHNASTSNPGEWHATPSEAMIHAIRAKKERYPRGSKAKITILDRNYKTVEL